MEETIAMCRPKVINLANYNTNDATKTLEDVVNELLASGGGTKSGVGLRASSIIKDVMTKRPLEVSLKYNGVPMRVTNLTVLENPVSKGTAYQISFTAIIYNGTNIIAGYVLLECGSDSVMVKGVAL